MEKPIKKKSQSAGSISNQSSELDLSHDLVNLLRNLLVNSLSFLNKVDEAGKMNWGSYSKVRLREDKRLQLFDQRIFDVSWAYEYITMDEQGVKLRRATETAAKCDKLLAPHIDKMFGTCNSAIRLTFFQFWKELLAQYFTCNDHYLTYNENHFESVLFKSTESLKTTSVEVVISAIAENCSCELEQIELLPNFHVKMLTPEMLVNFLNDNPILLYQYPLHHWFGISEVPPEAYVIQTLLQYRETLPRLGGDEINMSALQAPKHESLMSRAMEHFRAAVDSLRLLKDGNVRLGATIEETKDLGKSPWMSAPPEGLYARGGTLYRIHKTDAKEIILLFNQLIGSEESKDHASTIGFRRISRACSGPDWQDRVLDYFMGFEALLLNEGGGEGLSFRLGIRAALLIGESPEERKSVDEFFKRAYGIRSKIVHGSEIKKTDIDIMPRLEEYGRRIAKKILHLNSQYKKPDWNEWLWNGRPADKSEET
ncbi:MAG: HEPN domain-containing protein [candidate division Zixibacteria bacterium]|nr:HEPN domain-containing protein [candidate division Zixibacteria bacterium]